MVRIYLVRHCLVGRSYVAFPRCRHVTVLISLEGHGLKFADIFLCDIYRDTVGTLDIQILTAATFHQLQDRSEIVWKSNPPQLALEYILHKQLIASSFIHRILHWTFAFT